MRKISITVLDNGETHIKTTDHQSYHIKDGVSIDFFFNKQIHEKEMLYTVSELAKQYHWISSEDNRIFFDLSKLNQSYQQLFSGCQWMKGIINIIPIYENGLEEGIRVLSFTASDEEILSKAPQKIFLSHKGADKKKVREYYKLLKELGFDPWLDEEDMVAGSKLFRSILQGFKESCAVIFFITPQFKDEDYLEDEIDYSMAEKKIRRNFSIITLQFEDESGKKGVIPDLLKSYVWKNPKNDLEAFKEIIKSLPIRVGTHIWK